MIRYLPVRIILFCRIRHCIIPSNKLVTSWCRILTTRYDILRLYNCFNNSQILIIYELTCQLTFDITIEFSVDIIFTAGLFDMRAWLLKALQSK